MTVYFKGKHMVRVSVKVNSENLKSNLEKLRQLKIDKYDFKQLNLLISKGYACEAENNLFTTIIENEKNFVKLLEETINFVDKVQQSYLDFDENYASSLK